MNTIKCAHCGHENPAEDYKCQKCGRHLFVFCPCCGQWELRTAPARYQSWYPTGIRFPHRGMDPDLKALVMVAVVVGLGGLGFSALIATLPSLSARWESAQQDAYVRQVEQSTQPSINEQIERYRPR